MSSPLQVPQEDGGLLVAPPFSDVPALLSLSRERFRRASGPLRELRNHARIEALAAVRAYHNQADESPPEHPAGLILMCGHQPELFHPGVWLKNFALHRLARTQNGCPLHLLVDNDAVARPFLSVPVLGPRPEVGAIRIDDIRPGTPFEEWTVHNESSFARLPERVNEASRERQRPEVPPVADAPGSPMLPAFWDEVRRQAQHTTSVPERFAAARRTFERRWGCHNGELTVSLLCRTEAFASFACQLIAELPRFRDVFNGAVRAYRKAHRLRGRHHPFPDLMRDGDWLEMPFWTWRAGATQRARLFARSTSDGWMLRLGTEPGPMLSLAHPVRDWLRLEQDGIKVRSRAMTTTLFARLFIADLFMHGIGGAKYDAVTDEVIARFYGIEPPPFMVVSGTLRLPLPAYPSTPADVRRLARLLRDLQYNPQRHLDAAAARDLLNIREWVGRALFHEADKRERWTMIRRLNSELAPFLEGRRREVEVELERCRTEVEANTAVLGRRDWAFVLYPEDTLRMFVTRSPETSG